MSTSVLDPDVQAALTDARQRAAQGNTKTVTVDGTNVTIPSPYPSPADWRDHWIYLVMTDRFNNPGPGPVATWNQTYNLRQGGTFEGIRQHLPYLKTLGVQSIWITPVVKNPRPSDVVAAYAGYGAQDFLNLDERFASDGTLATAETELSALVDEAHARGIYVILDIVLNHAGCVFFYVYPPGSVVKEFSSSDVMNGPLGSEPPLQWLDATGTPNPAWQNTLPAPATLSPDDAVWPSDFQRIDFFRRRGDTILNSPPPGGFIPGDFPGGAYRQLVNEYDATSPALAPTRALYGSLPVISILIRAYQYMVAQFDFDGFRIDTVPYIRPDIVETFGNAMREFALTIGKLNFFTFGEIDTGNEEEVEGFVGRTTSGDQDGFGIDAAIDYPLFYCQLPNILKGLQEVEDLRSFLQARKAAEVGKISSHGEAGRYFVSFLDNHDQSQRFLVPASAAGPGTSPSQLMLGLAVLFTLQGIPCVYYGTEQGLNGTTDQTPTGPPEDVREALWGMGPTAFDTTNAFYVALQQIAALRAATPPLRYGRIYFREVAGLGMNFGQSTGAGGLIVFSRILADQEVVVVANTGPSGFTGRILVDYDLSQSARTFTMGYSNLTAFATAPPATTSIAAGQIYGDSGPVATQIASLPVSVASREVQIWVPS
jgi:glycosidase